MGNASFANRLVLNFTLVVFVGFLALYLIFNSLMDNHIRTEAEAELDREIMTVEFANDNPSHIEIILGARVRQNQAILNVDTIIVDTEGTILLPNLVNLPEAEFVKVEALANLFSNNQAQFETTDDLIMTTYAGHTFYIRAIPHYLRRSTPFFFEQIRVFVLMYTDITPAMNLKTNMNQILLTLLTISGVLTLLISIMLSTSFKRSINRIASHAKIIGQGKFNETIGDFNYSEFNNLAHSMNNMAVMLKNYETRQKQFFQNASHELRTPLTSIQGYTEGLKAGVFAEAIATEVILEETQKMAELINEILYLSKLNENNATKLNITTISITTLITNAAKRIQITATKKGKQITISPAVDLNLNTDADKLERALLNILSNAIRHANQNIFVNWQANDNWLTITIINDGPLINQTELPYIFDRFHKGTGGNTGLGLAITKEIITLLDGEINAKNVDKLVAFTIKLPRKSRKWLHK